MKLALVSCATHLASSGLVQAAPSSAGDSGLRQVPQLEDRAALLEKSGEADGATFTLRKRENECSHSTFVDRGNAASPLVSDCEILASNIRAGGRWTIHGPHRTLATFRSCRFGAQGGAALYTYVGNEDIMDLIRDSISKFRRDDGRVAAKGMMHCYGSGGGGFVEWGIFAP